MDMAKQRAEANTKAQPQNKKQDDLRTHVVAYKPIGKLVETDSIGIKSAIRNDINSLKYFVDGIQGKGNDYSVIF